MDERVWRLPGPRSFVRDIVAEHARGRHVTTVLPEALASDAQFTDGLAVIGALDTVVRKALGSQHSDVRDASRWLRQARNDLAHMRPLSLGDQESLQAACQILL
jgi:hypothetical protein